MSLTNGGVVVDAEGTRWRAVFPGTNARPVMLVARIGDRVTRKDRGQVTAASVEPPPSYEVDQEVALGGLPGVVQAIHGDGEFVTVLIHREPEPFGSMKADLRTVHRFAIDV